MASLFYLPGTIESDDEMEAGICSNANSSSRKSGDGGDSGSESSCDEDNGNYDEESSFTFAFDDGISVDSSTKRRGAINNNIWNFKGAIQTLSSQGAKKPFELLTEKHFAAKRTSANKAASLLAKAMEKKEKARKKAAKRSNKDDGDTNETSDEDDKTDEDNDMFSSDNDNNEDEEEEVLEEEPQFDDDVREMVVSSAEAQAQIRAEKKRRRDSEKDPGDDSREDAVLNSLDTDASAKEFFDEHQSSLPADNMSIFLDRLNKKGFGKGAIDVEQVFFSQLNLSRPLMRGVEGMGFVRPTPIQARVVPVALAGRDVCGSAKTGSGKTAAFLLPCLERLLFRPLGRAATRVLVVSPTRELAAQCHAMGTALARFCEPAITLL
jgi:ATP-dependent RNA helicase DDX27